jgi:hypothetical protein
MSRPLRIEFPGALYHGGGPGSGLKSKPPFATSRYSHSMSRPLRIEFPGALYHVTSRGDRREDILSDDNDRMQLLAVAGGRGQV